MKRLSSSLCIIWLFAWIAHAQYETQTIDLAEGWNGVYLWVQPDNAQCDSLCADWPVEHISLYNQERAFVQYIENPDEPVDSAEDYYTWSPNHSVGGNSLVNLLAGQAYLIYARERFTVNLTGRPSVPRMQWLPTGENDYINLMGFCVQSNSTFGTYLNGADFDSITVYTVDGTNTVVPDIKKYGAFNGSISGTEITPGQAYFISCDKVSRFCGPLRISPSGSDGLRFSSEDFYATATLKNESGGELDVSVELIESDAFVEDDEFIHPVIPALYLYDAAEGWQLYSNALTQTLNVDETWTLRFALDRANMSTSNSYGALLRCTDSCGGQIDIPVEAEYGEPDAENALWPSGLWVGVALFDEVSQVSSDSLIEHDKKAGGTMEYRLIVHVDAERNSRLLQRVIIAETTDSDGTEVRRLYTDENSIPADAEIVTRISSVAFGIRNNILRDAESTEFGQFESFSYVVAHDDVSNPFYHARHPRHDGLQADFETPLPAGDDFINYIPSIKPETFSVSNKVSLVFDPAAETGGTPLWNPEELVSGTIYHDISNLRKEGTLRAGGAFALRRISKISALNLNQ